MTRPYSSNYRPSIERACEWCGSSFRAWACLVEQGEARFCCRDCVNESRRARSGAARFWSLVDQSCGPDACWIYLGTLDDDGYGYFWADGQYHRAHRFAWALLRGPIPDGIMLCHDCPGGENRACVNPTHMFQGTALDNNRDMVAKGRQMRGEVHYAAKLTEQQVITIRERYAQGGIIYATLAQEYEVSTQQIALIVRGERWKHLPVHPKSSPRAKSS